MGAFNIIQLVLFLLHGVLASANAAKATATVELVSGAIGKLQSVIDTPVTKAQVENLRIEKLW
jgi:hypothetical protein